MGQFIDEEGLGSNIDENTFSDVIKIFGEDATFRPTGLIEVYITNDDGIHNDGFISGINQSGGMPKVIGYVNGQETQADGEDAQRYDGRIDLDPNSDNFGLLDASFGFQNTRFPHLLFNNEVTSIGTYQGTDNSSTKDKKAFEAIRNHPNFIVSATMELHQLKRWADYNKKDNSEIIEKLKANNPELGDIYENIVAEDIDYSKLFDEGDPGMFNAATLSNSSAGIATDGTLIKVIKEEDGTIKKVDIRDTGGVNIDYESLIDTFDDAPEEFKESFGVFGGGLLSLKYPHDAVYGGGGVAGQDHIVIEQFQYSGSQEQSNSKPSDYLKGLRRNSNIKQFIGVCRMPIPNNLSFSNGVSWGDGRINAVEAAAFLSANNAISTALQPGKKGIIGGLDSISKDMGQFLKGVSEGGLSGNEPGGALLSAFAAQFALGRIGINVDANQFIQRGIGQAINPNLELLFNGPKLRNFSFSFNFAPNDELDASVMRKIQRFFKQGMAPKRSMENLIFLGSPNIFRLRYRTKQRDRIKGLPMHKICALTTCEINYAPDNVYQSYDDSKAGSSPIRTVMNLNFTELTPVFADDYRSEFEQQSNESANGTFFSDEFGEDGGEGAFRPITTEDTGF